MAKAPAFPIFLDLVQKPVLVVGGGAVGLRKTAALVQCAARVTVVSPRFVPALEDIADIERIEAVYAATHMARKAWRLVFATTDVPAVNAQVYKHAEAAGILCCRADEPAEGDFSGGAVVRVGATRKSDGQGMRAVADGGGVMVAVSTSGASPVLASRICRQAAAGIDPILPVLADLLAEWRAQVRGALSDPLPRRALLERLAGLEMEELLRRQGADAARRCFVDWLEELRRGETMAREAPGPEDGAPDQAV